MNNDLFSSSLISQILTWIFSIPFIIAMLAYAVNLLFEKQHGIPRLYTIWVLICVALFSPLRYMLLQILIATAFPFQSFTGFFSSLLLIIYIPIVFGLLYAIGLGLPLLITFLIIGKKELLSKIRLFISGIVLPFMLIIFSTIYYNLLPYAAYSTHWLSARDIVRSTNGPSYYFYKYAVENFTPLQFPGITHDIGIEKFNTKERLRAHVVAVYCSNEQYWYYISQAYPEYYENVKHKYEKSTE